MSLYSEIMADSPTGYWRFDELTSLTDLMSVEDSSGNDNDATLHISGGLGTIEDSLVAGVTGKSLYLEAAQVRLPSLGSFTSFTAEWIIYAHTGEWQTDFGATNVWRLAAWDAPTVIGSASSEARLYGLDGSGFNVQKAAVSASGVAPRFNRYHYAATYDGSYLKLYVNGALAATYDVTATPWPAGPPTITTDSTTDIHLSATRARIDEAAFYKNTVLSAARIAAHYDEIGVGFDARANLPRWTGSGAMEAEAILEQPVWAQTARWTGGGTLSREDDVLVQVSAGVAEVIGNLTVYGPEDFAADSSGRASVSGSLSILRQIAAASAGSSSVAGFMGTPAGLVGSSDGGCSVGGTMGILDIVSMEGSIAGDSSSQGALLIKSKPKPTGEQTGDDWGYDADLPPGGGIGIGGGGFPRGGFTPTSTGWVTEDCM